MKHRIKNSLASRFYRRLWPDEQRGLLLGATLLEDDAATRCWNDWTHHQDIDNATWEDHKIFARLAGRLGGIAPESPWRPRLEGLAKAHWTQSQLMLRSSAVALDILREEGLEVMLLKGAALQAAPLIKEGLRITGDLDVMVRRTDFPRAMELLHKAGWRPNDSLEYSLARWRFAPGVNLHRKPHGDVDIHHQPMHGALMEEEVLEAFWQRALPATFLGRPVLVPALADLLVMAAGHAVFACSGGDRSATWVFDVSMLAKQPELTPARVAASARNLKAIPSTLAAFSYLRELTRAPAWDAYIAEIEALPLNPHPWLLFILRTLSPQRSSFKRRMLRYLFRLLGESSKRDIVPHVYPSDKVTHSDNIIVLDDPTSEDSIRREIPLPPNTTMKSMVLELAFHAGKAGRYQFDIAADGEALARLSVRVRKAGEEVARRCSVKLPQDKTPHLLAVESLVTKILPVNASASMMQSYAPVPFRLLRLSWK